jgi:hypothetical protein
VEKGDIAKTASRVAGFSSPNRKASMRIRWQSFLERTVVLSPPEIRMRKFSAVNSLGGMTLSSQPYLRKSFSPPRLFLPAACDAGVGARRTQARRDFPGANGSQLALGQCSVKLASSISYCKRQILLWRNALN